MVVLTPEIVAALAGRDPFTVLFDAPGELVRAAPGRRTLRVSLGGRRYYLKLHTGVGWREIGKNLLVGRLPVVGASNEWRALARLRELGIAAPHAVGFGSRGWNPARRQSFILTEALPDTLTLEDLYRHRAAELGLRLQRSLLRAVADIARTLHDHGINHRDFYLCHFRLALTADGALPAEPRLYLMDLHRAQIRRRTPFRWRAKDLGELYFSALETGLSWRDRLRFIRRYGQRRLRKTLDRDVVLWWAVRERARRLYMRHHGREPAAC